MPVFDRYLLNGMRKMLIAGIGGVGGTLAGVTLRRFPEEITLYARGARRKALAENGLVLHSECYGDSMVGPVNVEEDASLLEEQDWVFICTKQYSLQTIARQLAPCIGKDTVLIPLLNGIEAPDLLRTMYPDNTVLDAVVYTISASLPDYSIEQKGNYSYITLGHKYKDEKAMVIAREIADTLAESGLDIRVSEDIESDIWQKYCLNCGYNSITALYLCDSGEIRRDPSKQKELKSIMEEAANVGRAAGVNLPADLAESKFRHVMEKQADSAVSSMERDMEARRPTENDTFLGALIRKAQELNIQVPCCRDIYDRLKETEQERCHG